MLRQVEIGQAFGVTYRPSRLPSSAPTMTFEANGVSAAVALTAVADPFAVKVVASHRLSAPDGGPALDPSTLRGVTGEVAGDAVLDLGAEGGAYVVRIRRVTADYVFLDPQGAELPLDAEGTLHPNVWAGTLASGSVGAAVDRAGRWVVRYTSDDGADAPGESITEVGELRVVRYRFGTGCSDAFLRNDPRLLLHTPHAAQSWSGIIASTLPTLIADIEQVLSAGTVRRYADQTTGSQWRFAHGLLIVAQLVEAGVLEDPARLNSTADRDTSARGRYWTELRRTANRVAWIDTDDDGEIDDGEAQTGVAFDPSSMFYSTGNARRLAIAAGTVEQLTLDPYADR